MAGEAPFGSLGGQPIVSAATTIREFIEQGLDYSNWYRKANSYRCAVGPEPGYAWVLMQQDELKKLDSRQPQDLVLGIGAKSVTIKRLAFIQAQRLIPGASLDPDALYLVQLADVRWFLKRTYIEKNYNIRQTCGTEDWANATTKDLAGTPWTFLEIVEDLYSKFSTFGGFFTNAAYSADKVHGSLPTPPENLRFEGISAWDALAMLCQQCGFFLRYDPLLGDVRIMKVGTATDPYPATDGDLTAGYGGAKSALAGVEARFGLTPTSLTRTTTDELVEDSESILGSPLVPASVSVVFPTNDTACGDFSEIAGSHGWYYRKEVTAATIRAANPSDAYKFLDNTATGTTVTIHSTKFAHFSTSGLTAATNDSDLTTLANTLATDYYTALGFQATGRIVLGGIKQVIPGPTISEVIWRDWGDGLHTEVARWAVPVGLPKPPHLFTGGGGGCDSQNAKIDVTLLGNPAPGTFVLIWPTLDNAVTGTLPRLEFNTTDNATAAKAVMVTHSEVDTGDVTVTAGPWPNATMRFEFTGAWANTPMELPTAVWTDMAGGVGQGIICSMAQPGHA